MEHFAPAGQILMKFDILGFFRKSAEKKSDLRLQSGKNDGTLLEDVYICDDIWLKSSENEKCFGRQLRRESEHTDIFCAQ